MGHFVPKIWAVEGYQTQKKTKDITCFVWLYLKIGIWEFRLICLFTSHVLFPHYKDIQAPIPLRHIHKIDDRLKLSDAAKPKF